MGVCVDKYTDIKCNTFTPQIKRATLAEAELQTKHSLATPG